MDYLTPFDFAQLKAFFYALKESRFNLKQISSTVTMDGVRTPVNKPHCLQLIRSFPELSGEQFKDDAVLAKYLAKPDNVKRILSHLTKTQQAELTKTLEAKPVAIGDDSAQTGGQVTSAGQPVPVAGTGTGGIPAMPGGGIATPSYSRTRYVREIPIRSKTPLRPKITLTSGVERAPGPKITLTNAGENTTTPKGHITKDEFTKRISRPNEGRLVGEHTNPAGNLGSNINSSAQIGIRRASTRLGSGLSNMFKNMGRAGGDMMGGAIGGGGRVMGRIGLKGVDAGARFSKALSNRGSFLSNAGRKGAGRWVGLGVLGLVLLTGLLTAFAPASSSTPIIPPIGPTDISSCQFTRANESASYKSSLLLGYISEASNLSGIPPAILAAFIRVESPYSVNMNDDQTRNYASTCSVSPTGALGIMQIQPPGTTSARGDPASCDDCIDAGAALVGKTVSTMTRQDYCDPRISIIVASGWMLKKMNNLGYNNTGKWSPAWTSDRTAINALVNTYYGCLQYGGTTECTGPYNYGEDVYNGAQNCNVSPAPPAGSPAPRSTPPPTGALAVKQEILTKFGITMNGFDDTHLQWAWEKLWDVSNTNLHSYISGITITQGPGSEKTGLSTLRLEQYSSKELFKLVLMHEFGHFVQDNGLSRNLPVLPAAHQNAFASEGGVTYYAIHATEAACNSYSNIQEDYAEMVAYYLNPGVNIAVARCGSTFLEFTAPDLQHNFPLHYNVVRTVLGPY